MEKQNSSAIQTKTNLVDSFWKIYCEKGIKQITVKEIIEIAGYNRSTFYVYFKDTYDVLEFIENRILASCEEQIMSCFMLGIAEKDSREFIKLFVEMYEINSKYLSVLLGENGDPMFSAKFKKLLASLFRPLFVMSNKVPYIYVDYVLEYTLCAMIGILTYWLSTDKRILMSDLLNLLYDIMLEHKTGDFIYSQQ